MSFNGLHLLAPGESVRPLPELERAAASANCAGCGAAREPGRWSCSWCTLAYPVASSVRPGAILEITTLCDAAPLYWPGWEPPRPLPPSETPMALLLERAEHGKGRDPVWWTVGSAILVPVVLFAFAAWLVNP